MPIYEYACPTCGITFERRQSFHDTNIPACPHWHEGSQRRYGTPGIIFKGFGWYVTDNRRPQDASPRS
jgi:putative FmdB family regulatory protein